MKSIKYFLYGATLIFNLSLAQVDNVDINEDLLPEVKEIVTLKPVSKEEIRSSIYAGVYGLFAPKENANFLDYGADFLFDYNNEIQRLLKAGDAKALISFIEKNDRFVKGSIIQSPPKEIECFNFYFTKNRLECVEEWRKNRKMLTQYIDEQDYLLKRYIELQTLNQNLDLYFLPHLSLSYEGLSRVPNLYDAFNTLLNIRLLQAFYLLEDGNINEGLDILLSEKQFYEGTLKSHKAIEIESLGSPDFGFRQLTNLIQFISFTLDEPYFKQSLLNPKLTQLILYSPYNLPPLSGTEMAINMIKHQMFGKNYLVNFDETMRDRRAERREKKPLFFIYVYNPCEFLLKDNIPVNKSLNSSYRCSNALFESLLNQSIDESISLFHSLLQVPKWKDNKYNNLEKYGLQNNDKSLDLTLEGIEKVIIEDFVDFFTRYFSMKQLLTIKYLILASETDSKDIQNYLEQLGDLSLNPYTNTKILWNNDEKAIYVNKPYCLWRAQSYKKPCSDISMYLKMPIKF